MTAASLTFLGGAGGRLLPASIPLRFFGAAVGFHLLAWAVLAAHAGAWLDFRGGLGWPLAALHLVTLGVLGMTALGAGAQLVPVATRQAAIGQRWLAAIWWTYTPGVLLLALGMGLARPGWLAAGAAAVSLALTAWAGLMLHHLRGAHGMPGVRVHAWGALAALVLLLATALSLAGTWLGLPVPARSTTLALHLLFAPYGFMGLLALGLSYILVPMFALAPSPPERAQLASGALAVAALVLAGAAALGWAQGALRTTAWIAGMAAVLLHLVLMRRTLAAGMRPALGRSFVLVRIGWGALLVNLLLGAVLWLDWPLPHAAQWFGLSLLAWLLSLLLGMLQRILPFLGAMHAPPARRRAPTPSSLTHEPALRLHFGCHLAAFAGLGLALVVGSALVATAAALAGLAGAGAFGWFYLVLLRRMRPPVLAPAQGPRA